jgi:glycosyltransferase involved in cell wall biosynthesis
MTTVHILLATYNGERFLKEQLESIKNQSHGNWTLTVSDDGSTDDTLGILNRFSEEVPQKVTVLADMGPGKGPTPNFFRLIHGIQINSVNDLYAFCDQDDIWLDNKLNRAVQWHKSTNDAAFRLYCSRTQYVNEQLAPCGISPSLCRPPSFGNALVQNIASGNTMVMTASVIAALKKINPDHSVWHDWTAYLATTALGGTIEFDKEPSLLYRQHANNVIGSNTGVKAQLARLRPLLQGRYKLWSNRNESAMADILEDLPAHSAKLYNDFIRIRTLRNPITRLRALNKSSIRRQCLASNLSLFFASFLGLI